MSLRRTVKGLIRIHGGFAIMRVNSLGEVHPRKTSVDILEVLRKRLGKG